MTAEQKVHALWSAFEAGGPLAALDHLDADCLWVPGADLPDAGPLRGPDEIRGYVERLREEGVRLEPALHSCEAIADDAVLVGGRLRVVSRSSLSDSPLFWLYRIRGGRVVRVESYPCRRDALAAAA